MNYPSPKAFTQPKEDREREVTPTPQAIKCWEMYCSGMRLQQIGKEIGKTRERVRQILNKYYPDEYQLQKDENSVRRLIDRQTQVVSVCRHCGKESKAEHPRVYCSRVCLRAHMKKYEYPEWVGDRSIRRENFTKEEWKQINNFRTRMYYHTHREVQKKRIREYMKRTKERQYIYQKRCFERKIYGYAVTPLPGGAKNKAATKK